MSIFASILRTAYKLSGAKKAFALPEDALQKEIEKQNRHRGVFTPTDRKAYYEMIAVNGFPCLIVRERPKPSKRAILYFFGGGMVIGPDKGDLPVMRKLCCETGCDVWFPFYPLCMERCITETYAMVYERYRKMITLYGGGNVSTCGFSSGGALALGIAAHNNAQPEPLPQPRHIVAVSPGEVPWNDAEKARMQALNERDVSIDYAFMVTVKKFMRHGCENIPDYMLSGSRGDFTGVGDIHFFYSADEVLYGALPDFEEACKRANVPYTVSARPKMVHCYSGTGSPTRSTIRRCSMWWSTASPAWWRARRSSSAAHTSSLRTRAAASRRESSRNLTRCPPRIPTCISAWTGSWRR